jgi:Fe-S-cluster containining protein
MRLETDLARIQGISRQKDDENWRFRSFLKGYDGPAGEIDSVVHNLYKKVSSEIDCRQCANCCKSIQPALNQMDVRAFASGLRLPVGEFKERHLVPGDNPGEWRFNKLPCPFLAENLCTNYENRPRDCRSYPHLHKRGFTARLWNVVENYSICPIVFNVYEHLKEQSWDGNRLS